MATSNKNFRLKNGITVESLSTPGVLLNDASGDISSINGTSGYVLTSNGAGNAPTWQAATGGGGSGTTTNSLTIKSDSGTTEGTDLYTFNGSAAKTINFVSGTGLSISETAGTLTFNNTGVTSVGGTGTVSGLTLTGTVTTTGNLTLGGTLSVTPSNFATQTANTVLAGPTTGSAATPTFRALDPLDIPSLGASKITSETFDIARIPTGTTGTTVALGNHNHSLDSLSNVTITSKSTNDILQWNGTAWINKTLSGAGIAVTSGKLSQFASTTSSELLSIISDETGSGSLVFATNPSISNVRLGYTSTVTSASAIVLTVASNYTQYLTGSTAQTITLPDVTTLVLGHSFEINNMSSAIATVNSSGGNLVLSVPAGLAATVTCTAITGTTAASWDYEVSGFPGTTGTGNVVLDTSPTISDLTVTGDITANNYLMSGKNKIINSNFDFWQRGDSVSLSSATAGYTADRWWLQSTISGGTLAASKQTTGVPNGSQYCARVTVSGTTTNANFYQTIETANVIPMRNEKATLSVLMRRNATLTQAMSLTIYSSTSVDAAPGTVTTSIGSTTISAGSLTTGTASSDWTVVTVTTTAAIGSTVSTIKIGVDSGTMPAGAYYEIAQVQFETGSIVTPYARNAPNHQAELAACQRYYWRINSGATNGVFGSGLAPASTTAVAVLIKTPVTMRIIPTSIDISTPTTNYQLIASATVALSGNIVLGTGSTSTTDTIALSVPATVTSGTSYILRSNVAGGTYIGFSSEL